MSHSYVSNLPQTADTSSLMDHNAFATPPSRAFAKRSGRLVAPCGQPSVSRTVADRAQVPCNELLGYFQVVRFADTRKHLRLSD